MSSTKAATETGHAVQTIVTQNNTTVGAPQMASHLTGNAYVDSPKGSGKGKQAEKAASPPSGGAMRVRRRLSVVGGATVDGCAAAMDNVGLGKSAADAASEAAAGSFDRPHAVAHLSEKGYAPYNPAKVNQDSIVNFSYKGYTFYGALDGHGEFGHKVSQRFVAVFERKVKQLIDEEKFVDPGKQMSDILLTEELAMNRCSTSGINTEFSGTTMTLSCMRQLDGKEHLTAINAGDSRLILGRVVGDKVTTVEVTIDHKPDLPAEKARIVAKGGRVFALEYPGVDPATIPARVWLGNQDVPGLAMSRSLGDKVAHVAGVISTPEVFEVDIEKDMKYMVVASDGLWEFLSNEDVLDDVHTEMHGVGGDTNESARTNRVGGLSKVCKALKKRSGKKWLDEEQVIDDTSMVIAILNEF